jgi:hypothetical protein
MKVIEKELTHSSRKNRQVIGNKKPLSSFDIATTELLSRHHQLSQA